MKMNKTKGFTLIELLVVIAIIGILSSVVLASLNTAREKSRDAKRVSDIKQIQLALELYFDSNGEYPDSIGDLASSTERFLPSTPTDPIASRSYSYVALDDMTSPAACSSSTCLGYHLAAYLENNGNSVLDSDSDLDTSSVSGGFDGDSTDCAGTSGTDQCYDVTP